MLEKNGLEQISLSDLVQSNLTPLKETIQMYRTKNMQNVLFQDEFQQNITVVVSELIVLLPKRASSKRENNSSVCLLVSWL